MGNEILKITDLKRIFRVGNEDVHALNGVSFSVMEGEFVSIMGTSGSGKSTLLRCVNFLEEPTSGEIVYHGLNMMEQRMNEAAYRAKVGMVFQSFNLFNNMTVLKNCMDDPREIGEIVAERTGSELVHTIGKKIVLYKRNKDNPKIIL